jgi:hypothetical protein
MLGYKGFNNNFQGIRSFQYEIGREYQISEKPSICARGFHFVEKIEELLVRHPLDSNRRYAEIEALGDLSKRQGEYCTNHIRIIREIPESEVRETIFNIKIRQRIGEYLALHSQFEELIIGGSLALILQKTIPKRLVNDLDIVATRYHEFNGAVITRTPFHSEGDNALSIQIDDKCYDYFIRPHVLYKNIEWEGVKVKVQLPEQIFLAKFDYLLKGVKKHREDIVSYLTHIEKKIEIDDTFPPW